MFINILMCSLSFFTIKNIPNIENTKYSNQLTIYNNIINRNNNIINRNNNIVNRFKLVPYDYEEDIKSLVYYPNNKDNENSKIIIENINLKKIKILFYIISWFILSIKYNICNKQRLNLLNLPWIQSVGSLGSGSLIVMSFWKFKIRKTPSININLIKKYIPISFFHAFGHITAVISVSAGAVSFTNIVKSAEPIFTCLLNWIILGDKITLLVGSSLIPIVFGVSLASISELSFTWISFIGASLSNFAFASRNICSRILLQKNKNENQNNNISPENFFGVITIMSFIISIPFAILFEGNIFKNIIIESNIPVYLICNKMFETGLYFYLYNEAAMIVLNNIDSVSHAIINTLKRVILLFVCVIFFKTPLTQNSMIGSFIAIIGSYLYAEAKKKS